MSDENIWKFLLNKKIKIDRRRRHRFDVEFRQMDGEKTIWENSVMKFKNCKIEELHNNAYDYFYDGYEMWVSDTCSKTISEENAKYVISEEARNIIEDGYSLMHRKVHGKLVISPDLNSTPFGIRAYRFYRDYCELDDLVECFGRRKIVQFEKKINRLKRH
jgi:hypothetical protein